MSCRVYMKVTVNAVFSDIPICYWDNMHIQRKKTLKKSLRHICYLPRPAGEVSCNLPTVCWEELPHLLPDAFWSGARDFGLVGLEINIVRSYPCITHWRKWCDDKTVSYYIPASSAECIVRSPMETNSSS